MRTIQIVAPEHELNKAGKRAGGQNRNRQGKGRSFGAYLLADLAADHLWGAPEAGGATTPAWCLIAERSPVLRSVMVNLGEGRPAAVLGEREVTDRNDPTKGARRIVLARSARYTRTLQVHRIGHADLTAATIEIADLTAYRLEAPQTGDVRMLTLTPTWWEQQQQDTIDEQLVTTCLEAARAAVWPESSDIHPLPDQLPSRELLRALLPTAVRWLGQLAGRCRFAIPGDPQFALPTLLSALAHGVAALPVGLGEKIAATDKGWPIPNERDAWWWARGRDGCRAVMSGWANSGLHHVVATSVSESDLAALLSAQVRRMYAEN